MTRPINSEALDAMDDDALAEIAESMLAESKLLRRNAEIASFELTRRLRDRGATIFESKHFRGRLASGGFEHTITDPNGLAAALAAAGLGNEIVLAACPIPKPERRVDNRVLNELVKHGGEVARVIAAYRVSVPNDPKLELTRIADVATEPSGGE